MHTTSKPLIDGSRRTFQPEDFLGATKIKVKKGYCLVREGNESQKIAYLIESGCVEVVTECYDGTQTVLYNLYPGDLVGELTMMGVHKRSASIYAIEETSLLIINEKTWDLSMKNPSFMIDIYAMLLYRFIETTKVVSRLGQSTVLERLGTYLLTLPQWHEHNEDQIMVRLPTNTQLACLLNCTRERMSKVMGKLYQLKAVEKHDSGGEMIIYKSKLTAVLVGGTDK